MSRSRPIDMAYAELHAHSNFSFLDGASHPEELVAEAARLGLAALALTDHDGLYGVVRFAEAARAFGLPTVFGAELTLAGVGPAGARTGVPDPDGAHLVVLARDPEGYARLSRVIAEAHLAGGEKGEPVITLDALAGPASGATGWCSPGAARGRWPPPSPTERARRRRPGTLDRLIDAFGRDHVAVELWDHGDPLDAARNDALALLAVERGVAAVATNNVHYATPARFPPGHRAGRGAGPPHPGRARGLAAAVGHRPACAAAAEQAPALRPLARRGRAGRRAGRRLRLRPAPGGPPAPRLPGPGRARPSRAGCVELVRRGRHRRATGRREAERVPGAWAQIDHELDVIGHARLRRLLPHRVGHRASSAGGRTSTARAGARRPTRRSVTPSASPTSTPSPSACCSSASSPRRATGRRTSTSTSSRAGARRSSSTSTSATAGATPPRWPTSSPTGHARPCATWARRSAHAPRQVDAWSKQVDRRRAARTPAATATSRPLVVDLAGEVLDFPRHLGIHSGGMVLCDRPVVEVCPVEWARMPGRSVLQWDKDDCAAAGLVKFDLLGLGMLDGAAPHGRPGARVPRRRRRPGPPRTRSPSVYDLLCRADTVGVFQVESRAQMATLPRVQPRVLLRPGHRGGPHPARAHPGERGPPLHPAAQRDRARHLPAPAARAGPRAHPRGAAVPGAADADGHRRGRLHPGRGRRAAPGHERQAVGRAHGAAAGPALRRHGRAAGHRRGGRPDRTTALAAFANFGFPESHSVSFAHLVYSSAWCKLHYPAAFSAGLLNAQPMGFWSPQTLVADARRHGVVVRRPDVNAGGADAGLEEVGVDRGGGAERGAVRTGCPAGRVLGARDRRRDGGADRRGATLVEHGGPGPPGRRLPGPAGGAGHGRRPRRPGDGGGGRPPVTTGGPWCGGRGRPPRPPPDRLPGVVTGSEPPPLPRPTSWEGVADDLWSLGMAPDTTAMELAREGLDRRGVLAAAALRSRPAGDRITVGGRGDPPPAARERARRRLREPRGRDRAWSTSSAPGGPGSGGSRWPGRARRCWYGDGSSVRRGR